jgi:hypothetical protein
MSSKQLCIIFVGGVYAHTHACKRTYICICNCLGLDKFISCCCGETFVAHPITELYYYISYLISSSFRHNGQHRWWLVDVAAGILDVLKSYQYSGYLTGQPRLPCLCTDRVENTVSNSNSIVCVFVVAGTCLPIRCLETCCITPLSILLLHSNGCKRCNRKEIHLAEKTHSYKTVKKVTYAISSLNNVIII